MSEKSVLQRRCDDIGMLAWRLLGDEDTPPDFTAACPLLDALREGGQLGVALDVENRLVMGAEQVTSEEDFQTQRQRAENAVRRTTMNLRDVLRPVLYDVASAVGVLSAALDVPEPPPLKTGTSQVATVRTEVLPRARRVGTAVVLPDGRRGVVAVVHENGECDILVADTRGDEVYGDGSQEMMAAPPRRRR